MEPEGVLALIEWWNRSCYLPRSVTVQGRFAIVRIRMDAQLANDFIAERGRFSGRIEDVWANKNDRFTTLASRRLPSEEEADNRQFADNRHFGTRVVCYFVNQAAEGDHKPVAGNDGTADRLSRERVHCDLSYDSLRVEHGDERSRLFFS